MTLDTSMILLLKLCKIYSVNWISWSGGDLENKNTQDQFNENGQPYLSIKAWFDSHPQPPGTTH